MKKIIKLMADFETNTSEEHCRVWGSCVCDIETLEIVQLSNNIDDFIDFLNTNAKKYSLEVYFHNLKFDGEFIISYLYQNGYAYNDFLATEKTFRTVISDMGLFYKLEIRFTGKRSKIVVIKDSLKIIPLPVRSMAKAFGLKTLKGDIDYDITRDVKHFLTPEEVEYMKNDVLIVAQSLKEMFNLGLTKMTIASNALHNYKESIGGKYKFRDYFPLIPKEDDSFIRKAYRGGYTYVNPYIQYKHIRENGMTFDVNSLYPSRMYYDLLPYGMPIYYKGKYPNNDFYPLYIQRIKCKFKLKKGYVPTIQIKNNSRFNDHEYLKDSGIERVELTLTNVDLDIMFKHYKITNLEYIDGYMFKGGHNLFKKYIEYWINVKNEATRTGNKGLRQIAKLMLNSLYGKFATNGSSDVKIPYMDNNNIIKQKSKCLIDDVENFEGILKDDKEMEFNYTAMACFITAYARKVTIDAIQDVGGITKDSPFCYCDTDSIHIRGTEIPKNLWVNDVELGAWKHESNWCYAKFLRAKTYMEEILMIEDKNGKLTESLDFINFTSKKLDIKCAGMSENVKKLVTKDNFKVGFKVLADDKTIEKKYKKLMPKRVKNGIILTPTDFTIK